MRRFGFFVKILLILGLWPGIMGCPSSSSQSQVKESEYKKLLEQQKQKSQIKEDEAALKKVPEMTADGYERLGDTFLKKGDLDFAFVQYNKALNLEPKSIRIRYKMAGLFLTKGLADDAQAGFLSIIEEQPDFAPAYDGLGRVYFIKGDIEKATANFNQALRINPQLWQSHNYLGIIKDKQKDYDKAVFHYKEAIALRPDIGLLYNNLGMSYLLQGDYEKAVKAFNQALDKGETDPKITNNLALALIKLKRHEEALTVFKLVDTDSTAYFKIGDIYFEEKNYPKAVEAFEKAVDLNPKYDSKTVQKLKLARKYLNESAATKK
jgi:Flp pilus assembly protein TadD